MHSWNAHKKHYDAHRKHPGTYWKPGFPGGGEQLVDPGMQSDSHTLFYSLEINSQTQMDMNRKDLF